MSEVSKFIPMGGYGNNMENEEKNTDWENKNSETGNTNTSSFKVCGSANNLPAKNTSFWSKLKGILTYEIKVELTPAQQKVEDEINEFLHQEVTWQSFKNFLFQDITFGKKA